MPNEKEIVIDFPLYINDEYTIKIIAREQDTYPEQADSPKYLEHNIVIMKRDSLDHIPYIWFYIHDMKKIILQLQNYVNLIESIEFGDT